MKTQCSQTTTTTTTTTIAILPVLLKKKKKKKNQNTKVFTCMWRNWDSYALLVGIKNSAAPVGNRMAFPQKLKTGLLFDQAVPMLGIYPKEVKAGN